jgi:hypothetical protein
MFKMKCVIQIVFVVWNFALLWIFCRKFNDLKKKKKKKNTKFQKNNNFKIIFKSH